MPPAGRYRWVICSLLFFATTINFTLAYAIGLLAVGPLIDRLGTKLGFALAIAFWSLAAIGHAVAHLYNGPAIPSIDISASTGFAFVSLVGTVAGFSLARFALA